MKVNESYESFVLRTCRQQRTARTLHDAYRSGEYGYSIHLFKDDVSQAWDFFKEAFIWFAICMGIGVVAVAFLTWLGVIA